MQSALHYSHQLLTALIDRFPKGTFVDATLGNGHDTAFILQKPNFHGQVLAFDIQDQALTNSQDRLNKLGLDPSRYQLIHDSHANLEAHLTPGQKLQAAIFNLGYLPGGDHQITTQWQSTLTAIKTLAQHLDLHGQLILVVYWGHPQGQVESTKLLAEVSQWSQTEFQVLQYQFLNQANQPPYVIVIERIKTAKV
ncbi:putative rRNA methylase [Eremococcus coleocola ACS-139-V-Col8]|uniref:Putative rRNA methylase n=2 Tax=Eremococcus TaxID=171412 RepID=E4KNA7_9LACT|nr:putative rRNA methylase [Eremococcus coleocola ACS-139-V-Col8]